MALMALMALMAHDHRRQRDGDRRRAKVRVEVTGDGEATRLGRDGHRFAVSEVDCDDLGKLVDGLSRLRIFVRLQTFLFAYLSGGSAQPVFVKEIGQRLQAVYKLLD